MLIYFGFRALGYKAHSYLEESEGFGVCVEKKIPLKFWRNYKKKTQVQCNRQEAAHKWDPRMNTEQTLCLQSTGYSEMINVVQVWQGHSGINHSYIPGCRASLNIQRATQLYFGSCSRRIEEESSGRIYVPAFRHRLTENLAQKSFQTRKHI